MPDRFLQRRNADYPHAEQFLQPFLVRFRKNYAFEAKCLGLPNSGLSLEEVEVG